MPIVKLDDEFISTGLQCPSGKKRIEYVDRDLGGFYIECRATSLGEGTYYQRFKEAGKMVHHKLGCTMEISLADARRRARSLKRAIADGDQSTGKKKHQVTYRAYFNDSYLPYAMSHKRSWKMDENLFRLRLDNHFGSRNLTDITRQKIQRFHVDLKQEEGLAGATADHYLQLLKRTLSMAVDDGLLESSQAKTVKLFRDNNIKDRYMNEKELQRLMAVLLRHRNNNVSLLARLILATGVRKNEALKARWADIDLSKRTWVIPKANAKSKKTDSIPLNDAAVQTLMEIDTRNYHEHVFVNKTTGERLQWVNKTWGRLRTEAGLEDISIHQLRAQYAYLLCSNHVEIFTVQRLLRHANIKTTVERYAHLSPVAMQEASEVASTCINKIMKTVG